MVLVTSANGTVGHRIIPQLKKAGIKVKAMDINPAVASLTEIGADETFCGDGRSMKDLKTALTGCDQVLYIPPLFVYDEGKMAMKCIDAAVESDVRQFVMMSVTHPLMSTLLQHTEKLKAEEYLVYKGLSDGLNYTILQPMHYSHGFHAVPAYQTGVYRIFYALDAKLSLVDVDDVGEVAAKVLTEDGHQNATYELVNHDYISSYEQVEVLNRLTGANVKAEFVPIDEWLQFVHCTDSYGMEAWRALADTYSRYGIAGNANVLTWLLGREPTSFEEGVRRELDRAGIAHK